jgi:hypothetical protein
VSFGYMSTYEDAKVGALQSNFKENGLSGCFLFFISMQILFYLITFIKKWHLSKSLVALMVVLNVLVVRK